MKRNLLGIVMIGVIGGNIAYNAEEWNKAHPVIFTAEAKEPDVVLIEAKVDWTKERIEHELRSTFTETPNTAVAVAKAESGEGLNPNAYNPEWHYDKHGNKICQGSYGVMQVACVHNLENPEALFDVEFNIKKAREIYRGEGWKPWGGYTSGGYKQYLK